MESFRSPEVLRPVHEFRPELQQDRDLCLKSLLHQVNSRANGQFDNFADEFLIEGINNAVVASDESEGAYQLACRQPDCEANCVMVVRTSDKNGGITIVDPSELDECLIEQ